MTLEGVRTGARRLSLTPKSHVAKSRGDGQWQDELRGLGPRWRLTKWTEMNGVTEGGRAKMGYQSLRAFTG